MITQLLLHAWSCTRQQWFRQASRGPHQHTACTPGCGALRRAVPRTAGLCLCGDALYVAAAGGCTPLASRRAAARSSPRTCVERVCRHAARTIRTLPLIACLPACNPRASPRTCVCARPARLVGTGMYTCGPGFRGPGFNTHTLRPLAAVLTPASSSTTTTPPQQGRRGTSCRLKYTVVRRADDIPSPPPPTHKHPERP